MTAYPPLSPAVVMPAASPLARIAGLRAESRLRSDDRESLDMLARALADIDGALAEAPAGIRAETARLASAADAIRDPTELLFASFAMHVGGRSEDAQRILDYAMTAKLKPIERSFLFWQLSRFYFLDERAFDVDADRGLRGLHRKLVRLWAEKLRLRPRLVPPAKRNARSILVMANQILGPNHAPTADTLDYCRNLLDLGYSVELMCCAELPAQSWPRVHRPFLGNYNRQLAGRHALDLGGVSVPFWQAAGAMPNERDLKFVLRRVQSLRPMAVLAIGGSMVSADLCAAMTSVIALPTSTRLPISEGQVLCRFEGGRAGTVESDRNAGHDVERILPVRVTYRLPARSGSIDPASLRLPAGSLRAVIVGNRLDDEINGAVVDLLNAFLKAVPELYILFVGPFSRHCEIARRHPLFAERTRALGYCADIRAVYEHCDIYLNPPRGGGGSSAAFALADGLPVLSFDKGDVALVAGDGFLVEGHEEMKARLAKCAERGADFDNMRKKAKARFAALCDRHAFMRDLLQEAEARGLLQRRAPIFSDGA